MGRELLRIAAVEIVLDDDAPGLVELLDLLGEDPDDLAYHSLGPREGADFFTPYFREPTLIQRVLRYPAGESWAGKHTDNGIFTILWQQLSDPPALRVHSRGRWIDVPWREGACVINLGDMLQLWTSGRCVSTPHEVVHRGDQDRYSIALFVYPDIDSTIEPLDGGPTFRPMNVMLNNFDSIWVEGQGAGRARELR